MSRRRVYITVVDVKYDAKEDNIVVRLLNTPYRIKEVLKDYGFYWSPDGYWHKSFRAVGAFRRFQREQLPHILSLVMAEDYKVKAPTAGQIDRIVTSAYKWRAIRREKEAEREV